MDMAQFVIPKSDQLNADDLIAGPRTIRITKVSGTGNADQPVAVYFDGDNGKPYKPCKGMRRVMIAAWGVDAAQYVGRSMTLYRDPEVMFGGMKVGGIRISHMTDIAQPLNLALTVTKAKRAPYRVMPLAATKPNGAPPPADPTAPVTDAPSDAGSGGEAITAWDAGWVEQTKAARIPLNNPATGEVRYFATVGDWCKACAELVDAGDWHEVWTANLETHTRLTQAARSDEARGHLKAIADYVDAARQADKLDKGPGA